MSASSPPASASLAVQAQGKPTSLLKAIGKATSRDGEAPVTTQVPADESAEVEVLGAILAHAEAFAVAQATLLVKDFYSERHQAIYAAMVSIAATGAPTNDAPLLIAKLRDRQVFDQIGGLNALSPIMARMGHVSHMAHYVERVKRISALRSLYETSERVMLACSQARDAVPEFFAEAEATFQEVFRQDIGAEVEFPEAQRLANLIERCTSGEKRMSSYSTGLTKLDEMLGGMGLIPGWFVVVLAPPKCGKTAFVMNNLAPEAMKYGSVMYFGEMSEEDTMLRWLARGSGVPLNAIRNGSMSSDQASEVSAASDRMGSWRWKCYPPMPVDQIAAKARTYKEKTGKIAMLVVDYIQLIHNGIDNRTLDIEYSTRGLKLLGAELECVVVGISQPTSEGSRQTARGGNLTLFDGRGANSIAADCDLCLVPKIEENGVAASISSPGARHVKAFSGVAGDYMFSGTKLMFTDPAHGESIMPPPGITAH